MRTEAEMMQLLLETAKQDTNIVGVYQNGSRANPKVQKDIFQDYDIVYVVQKTAPYIFDKTWIDRFGERLLMQDVGAEGTNAQQHEYYGWLMLFTDGNRIDLHIETISHMQAHISDESLCEILLDKQGIFPELPISSDRSFWIKKPSQTEFSQTCNEFWWCLNNVAKGIWRGDDSYAFDQLNYYVRPMLLRLLEWKAGSMQDFQCSGGKSGKYLKIYLGEHLWKQYLKTYVGYDSDLTSALLDMMTLFEEQAILVSQALHYSYHIKEGKNAQLYVRQVLSLSPDATSIFPS